MVDAMTACIGNAAAPTETVMASSAGFDQDYQRDQWHPACLVRPYGDLDRNGMVNRRNRDRDGDGVRNRDDRLPDNPYRR